MNFYDNFIGDDASSIVLDHIAIDTDKLFAASLLTQPQDWYYRNHEVKYSLNSHGHRSKEISDIDFDNYILFAGASASFGAGLELDLSYAAMTSKLVGCDYYNLGVSGSGVDVLMYNIVNWMSVAQKKPKAVIIHWPDYNRFVTNYTTRGLHKMRPVRDLAISGIWSEFRPIHDLIMAGDDVQLFQTRRFLATKLLKTVLTCPVYNIVIDDTIGSDTEIEFKKIDFSRDLYHQGIESSKGLAEILHKRITQDLS